MEDTRNAAYDALLASLADGAFVCDVDGRIERCNEELARIFGYDAAELVGMGVEMLMPEARRAGHDRLRRAWVAAPLARPMRALTGIQGQRKSGELIDIEIGLVPFRGAGPLRVTGVVRDVTERNRAEQRLLRETTRHRVLANFAAGILTGGDLLELAAALFDALEAEGLVTHAVLAEHDREGQIIAHLASSRQTHLRRARLTVPRPTHWTLADLRSGAALTGESVVQNELRGIGEPYMEAWVELGLRATITLPIVVGDRHLVLTLGRDAAGSIDAADVAFFETLASHLRIAAVHTLLNEQLAAAQKSVAREQRLGALGQMAAGIVHDVNNAVSPILSFSRMLLDDEPNLSESAVEALTMIEMCGTDMHNIAKRLKRFIAQRPAGEAVVDVDLNELASRTLQITSGAWRKFSSRRTAPIAGVLELAPEAQAVPVDETEIREALVNLIFNAVDAMPAGGTLTVRTGKTAHGEPFLEVADTGEGMDEDTVNRCVDPFFTTKGSDGSGLGLSMAFGTMRKFGGELLVQSEVNVGTTIRLAFPAQAAADATRPDLAPDALAATSPEPIRQPGPADGERLLVVDDDARVRRVIVRMLTRLGYAVTEVADGTAAVAELGRQAMLDTPFALLVTDLAMPSMDGRELARIARSLSPSTRVLMLTALAGIEATADVLQHGVDRLIGKPIEPLELARAVASLLVRRRFATTAEWARVHEQSE